MSWDRSKQKYWILHRQDICRIVRMCDSGEVIDLDPRDTFDAEFVKRICFAESDDEVKDIVLDKKIEQARRVYQKLQEVVKLQPYMPKKIRSRYCIP